MTAFEEEKSVLNELLNKPTPTNKPLIQVLDTEDATDITTVDESSTSTTIPTIDDITLKLEGLKTDVEEVNTLSKNEKIWDVVKDSQKTAGSDVLDMELEDLD